MKLKIIKGDIVQVISGNYKGETGRVLEVYKSKMQILVEGINIRKRHTKPSQQNQKGGIIDTALPIHYSNVMILDSDKEPTRIGVRRQENDGKITAVRFARTNENDL